MCRLTGAVEPNRGSERNSWNVDGIMAGVGSIDSGVDGTDLGTVKSSPSKVSGSSATNRDGSIRGYQSRRDCDPKPGVARHELPRGKLGVSTNPNGVAPARRNPVGVANSRKLPPGVGPRRGPTPGFGTESRRDSRRGFGRSPVRTGGSWRAACSKAPCSRALNRSRRREEVGRRLRLRLRVRLRREPRFLESRLFETDLLTGHERGWGRLRLRTRLS